MSFLVYLFVLLVAAGSVIFGLDWTQAPLNPPPYATPPAQTATIKPATATPKAQPAAAPRAQAVAAAPRDDAAQAQASATDHADQPEATAAVAHCNIAACSGSYRSFRASDCTYQPYEGPRRVCTKAESTGRVAAVHRRSARNNNAGDESRVTDRRDYRDRSGWGFDFFGRSDGYDSGR